MNNFRLSIMLFTAFLCHDLLSQNTTRLSIRLDVNDRDRIEIKVFPPLEKNSWKYVIPEIIPGTYMKINYERFYDKIYAFDNQGNKMKVKKKDNVFLISGDHPLDHLSFTVEQTLGDSKIWDNILGCAGTIFTEDSYLLNFQLVSGYFEGFADQPFTAEILKQKDLYGATSMESELRSSSKDIYKAENYARLIDQPILYAKADTTSFMVGDNRFRIALHAETGKVKAEMLKPRLTKIMHAIDTFSGFTSEEDYHFVFYYVNKDRLKGLFKNFGMGSALEHNYSSFYYFSESVYDTTFSNLDWIGSHEYFHTISPLSLHSEKIHHFNFETPDMSRHGWLYEGVTDYFSALLSAQHKLTNSFTNNMRWAVQTAEKQKLRSFTQSSQNIIKKNMFSWIGKIGQIGNFYERGKLVALGLDMEIYERSNRTMRLPDVVFKMKDDLNGSYFSDDQFAALLVKYTYPEMQEFYDRYIEGEEIVPYEAYFEKLGWDYYPKGRKLPGYGSFNYWYDSEKKHYYVNWQKKNALKLKKGDIIQSVNGIEATPENAKETEFFRTMFYPEPGDQLTLNVLRSGKEMILSGEAKPQKLKFPRIIVRKEFTPEQEDFRKGFYRE
ncbi:MAG: hypothetical protein RIM99_19610 [Cyclobacteriaceae bacterium]